MKIQQAVWAFALGAASLGAYAQSPDNTAVNKEGGTTADQQKNTRSDLDLTKNIRRSIVQDKSLSSDAHNVKVIAQNGTVTLKGPVKSEEERKSVLSKATSVVGDNDKVIDQMSVKQ